MVCPHCNQDAISARVGFTWWGGFIGAGLLSHVECTSCRGRYNGKTGKLNTTAIAIYVTVLSLVGFGAAFALLRH